MNHPRRCIWGLGIVAATLASAGSVRGELSRQQRIGILNEAVRAFDQATDAAGKDPDRGLQLYRGAAQGFEALVNDGVVNGKLYYNLGNTYLRMGELGRAILWYRRAQALVPGDGRLAGNLEYARSRRRNQLPTGQARALLRRVFFWHYGTALGGRLRTAALCYGLVWVLLAVHLFRRGTVMKAAAAVLLIVSLAAAGSVARQTTQGQAHGQGVVVADDVSVHVDAGENYDLQFKEALHQGVEFGLIKSRGDWHHVELPDGKSGWIRRDAAELI